MLDFIKELILYNSSIRKEDCPANIYDYTITNERYSYIKDIVDKASSKKNFEIIQPIVFSKGINRLYGLIDFINWINATHYFNNLKAFLIAQFIVLNQIFSDGNHRSAIYFLEQYGKFNKVKITEIMTFTERIHKWDGDLNKAGLWVLDTERLLKPQIDLLLTSKQMPNLS